jgi:hypothetical protein
MNAELKGTIRRAVQAIDDALPAVRQAKLLSHWARLTRARDELQAKIVDITETQPIDPDDLP